MATGRPDTVEMWAPMFLAHWSKEQILDPKFAVSFGHCKLCDDKVVGSVNDHLREHRKELTAYLNKRRKESAKNSVAALALARREKQMLKAAEEADAIIANPGDYLNGDDDDE